MARTGLRMMPTFPSPPLKFRTAGFPRYGPKAGLSDEAFPAGRFAIVLRVLWLASGNRMSQASRRDYLQRIYPCYQKASRTERQRILDEFCANCSYHRKHAIRLLNHPLPQAKAAPRRRPRGRTYGSPTRCQSRATIGDDQQQVANL
jgi:hypothetical protein